VTRENASKTLEIVPEAPRKPKARTIRQVHRRLRPDEIEYLADGYRSGLTVYELSDRFRIDRRTVALVLKRSEVPLRHQPLSPTQVEQAIALYKSGLSLVRVAEIIGCSHGTIWHRSRMLESSFERGRGGNNLP
jgi:DNA-binding CsgD family transcriptional regulator